MFLVIRHIIQFSQSILIPKADVTRFYCSVKRLQRSDLSGFADRLDFFFFFSFVFTPDDPGPAVFQCLAHPEKISYVIGIKLDFLFM